MKQALSAISRQPVISIAVAAPVGGLYDYLAGPAVGAVRGSLVIVPFGGRQLPGIVMGSAKGHLPPTKLREVALVIKLPPLSDAMVQFIERVSAWTMAPLGAVVKMVLSQPAAFGRPPQQKVYRLAAQHDRKRLTAARQRVVDYLGNADQLNDGDFAGDIIASCGVSQAVLNGMETAGLLEIDLVSADCLPPEPMYDRNHLALSDDQQNAAQHLCAAIW